jgi:hypothetical protein
VLFTLGVIHPQSIPSVVVQITFGERNAESEIATNTIGGKPMRGAFQVLLFCLISQWAVAHDFDLSKHSIPPDKIVGGGPPKDGIPSLTDPKFIPASAVNFLRDDDRVIGLLINGVAKAYPHKILTWHEAVNDKFNDTPVAVTY